MKTDDMLRAIYRLTEKEIGYTDYTDVTTWVERSGPEFDTTKLLEKSRERIEAIFNRFYEVKV